MRIKFIINYVMELINKQDCIKIRSISFNILKDTENVTPVLFGGVYKVVDMDYFPNEIVCLINDKEQFFLKDVCHFNSEMNNHFNDSYKILLFVFNKEKNMYFEDQDREIVNNHVYIEPFKYIFNFLIHKPTNEKIKLPWQSDKDFNNYVDKFTVYKKMENNYFKKVENELIQKKIKLENENIDKQLDYLIKDKYPKNYDEIIKFISNFNPSKENVTISKIEVESEAINRCKHVEIC